MLVTVYSLPASVCVRCRAVEISMRRKGIDAKKVRVDLDPEALEFIKGLGYSEAPVTVVTDGDRIVDHWSGYSDDKICELGRLVAA